MIDLNKNETKNKDILIKACLAGLVAAGTVLLAEASGALEGLGSQVSPVSAYPSSINVEPAPVKNY